jgi:hypothetical protein
MKKEDFIRANINFLKANEIEEGTNINTLFNIGLIYNIL